MRLATWLYLAGTIFGLDSVAPGTVLVVHQVTQWNYFQLPVNSSVALLTTTLTLENANSQLVFMLRASEYPTWKNGKFTADLVDVPGWQYNSTQHSLSLRANSFSQNAVLYLGVLLLAPENSTDATYTLQTFESAECPYLCRFKGECTGGQCRCQTGRIGSDCRISASALSNGDTNDFVVSTRSWRLYTQSVADAGSGYSEGLVLITVGVTDPSSTLYVIASLGNFAEDDTFPNFYHFAQMVAINSTRTLTFALQMDARFEALFISFYSQGEGGAVVSLKARLDSVLGKSKNTSEIPVMIGVGSVVLVALFGVLSGCSIYLLKRRRMRRHITVIPTLDRSIPQEKVELMFPHKTFEVLEGSGLQDTCTICFEKFKSVSEVRVLPCKHVYHLQCIDSWFRTNHICCLCKLDCSHPIEDEARLVTSPKTIVTQPSDFPEDPTSADPRRRLSQFIVMDDSFDRSLTAIHAS